MNRSRWAVIFAVGTTLLFLLSSSLGGALVATANANAASPSTIQAVENVLNEGKTALKDSPVTTVENALQSGTETGAQAQAFIASLMGPYAYLANEVPTSRYASLVADFESGLQPAQSSGVVGGAIQVGGLAVVAAVCFAAGVETVGLACVAAFVVFGILLVLVDIQCDIPGLSSVLGGSCSNPAGVEMEGIAKLIVENVGLLGFNVIQTTTTNLINALNLTETALAYEAAAGALNQLGNATFNVPLDLVQSGVAQELASEAWAQDEQIAYVYSTLLGEVNDQEYENNPTNQYCDVSAGPLGSGIGVPAGTVEACPQSFSGTLSTAQGTTFGSWLEFPTGFLNAGAPDACPAWYILTGSPISGSIVASNHVLTFIPVSGSHPWFNETVTSYGGLMENQSFDGPSGGYFICSGTGAMTEADLYLNYAFPLSSGAIPTGSGNMAGGTLNAIWDQPTSTPPSPSAGGTDAITELITVGNLEGSGIGVGGYLDVSSGPTACQFGAALFYANDANLTMGNTADGCVGTMDAGTGAMNNFGNYLWTLANFAASEARVYWTFLHYTLGYTSIAEVPSDCLVPSPAQLLPPNIDLSSLSTMNVTSLLMWYQSQLRLLANTFNLNETLNATTICGKHPTWTGGNGTIGFGVYGVGYIYVAGAGVRSSDGKVLESFSNPETWNISGEFYIAPTVHSLAPIPTNKTFILPALNPVSVFDVPFLKNTSRGAYEGNYTINATGPTWCVGESQTSGCETDALKAISTGYLVGNSTAGAGLIGSVYPTDKGAGAATAVYIVGCYVAQPNATMGNAVYHTSGSCDFNVDELNGTGTFCSSAGIEYQFGVAIGTCTTTIIIVPPPNGGCGGGIWLLGNFIDDIQSALGGGTGLAGDVTCAIAWIITIVIAVVIIAVIAWAIRLAVGRRRY